MRIGIIGTGRIAHRFVPECEAVRAEEIKITAVYNPHKGSAEKFINDIWGKADDESAEAFSDLKAFFNKIDAVYIASPHNTHYEYIVKALNNDKHVLCEKPMTLKKDEALKAYDIADKKGLILVEGIKTAYCSGYKKLLDTVKSGITGDIRYIDVSFTKIEDKRSRELTDREYGGSFIELGSYVMLPVFDILGRDYENISFESLYPELHRSDKNVSGCIDVFTRINLKYPQSLVTLTCGLGVKTEGRLMIGGSKGYIIADAPWWKTTHFGLYNINGALIKEYIEAFEGDGLRYELEEFLKRIKGSDDCSKREHEKVRSIYIADMMEHFINIRKQAAIK